MYVMVTGAHPLYTSGVRKKSYIAKIANPKWTFPPTFSLLARSLFLQLVRVNPLERYSAKEALMHPWITREVSPIPLSFVESAACERARIPLLSVLLPACITRPQVAFALMFLEGASKGAVSSSYTERLDKVSAVVSDWHHSNQLHTECM